MIAIPDFAAGAMENWGLITYREVRLLCQESSSLAIKKSVIKVICHELAVGFFCFFFWKYKNLVVLCVLASVVW